MNNDWGLPDWRDSFSYGDTTRWKLLRWRWEFYRRRDDLRQLFQSKIKTLCQNTDGTHTAVSDLRDNLLRSPFDPGFLVDCSEAEKLEFGYAGIPNPRISDQEMGAIFSLHDAVTIESEKSFANSKGLGTNRPLSGGKMHITFDIDRPIDPQLKAANRALKKHQVAHHGKNFQRRRHPKKWLGYLQTLDAREAKVTWSEIAKIHAHTKGDEQAARDIWEQANILRFDF
ncbi:hypothetical protein [Loktanella sp. Alg231-35]|uniref:hypothetical protein n=1 Tax=Loktanella sp. Alg231-35 TaxID=1922220 RepID=UPI000D55408C|nr:hypothetical protein [Loktanella sp. Alg231-35]